jgi:hypothetical protein
MKRHVLSTLCLGLLLVAASASGANGTLVGLTMRDAPTDCIKSDDATGVDGSVEYINGVEGVIARIDRLGYIYVSLKDINPYVVSRHFYYDFTQMLANGADGSPSPEHQPMLWQGTIWRTDLKAMPSGVPGGLNGMAVGSSAPCALCFDIYPMYAHQHWWLVFDNGTNPGSTYATATRVDETTWTIEATASDVAELLGPARHVDPTATAGYYCMPFRMTIRKL